MTHTTKCQNKTPHKLALFNLNGGLQKRLTMSRRRLLAAVTQSMKGCDGGPSVGRTDSEAAMGMWGVALRARHMGSELHREVLWGWRECCLPGDPVEFGKR